ncbi:NAD(P)/FAD-dependent oxidoreductase [Mycobacterium sherrisii]|uniref:NAD(P)/FAD-dependent oxidoreductase n=1 Tax=Mycobacterium sherrisii TaxID=243061 RepID=UPI0039764569
MQNIEADYLVIGAGAMGMAFVDTLLTETSETSARVVMVDRNAAPGGHWNAAYPFVRLHQPSAFYGVNSLRLGRDTIERTGWNEGLYELASAEEVLGYYDHVMRRRLLPTGRVEYFPNSEYLGAGRFVTAGGEQYRVRVAHRVVDATYLGVTVPAMRPPPYPVAPEVACIPPNDLPGNLGYERYVIVGAGKTGIDTCLWLLAQGIDPERLTWIMPRDSWLLDRATMQPGPMFAVRIKAAFIAQLRAIRDATSPHDLLIRLEDAGTLLRVQAHQMVLEGGVRRVDDRTLYLDCSADGAEKRPATPIFESGRITLQSVRGCQQVFSAALTAHVEAAYADDDRKNRLGEALPHPDTDLDWLRLARADYANQLRWFDDPELTAWLSECRLDLFGHLVGQLLPPASAKPRVRERILGVATSVLTATAAKLDQLVENAVGKT